MHTAASAALVVLAAAACSTSQGQPKPAQAASPQAPSTATSTSLSSPSTAMTAEAPAIPEAARANTAQGAEAFTKYFGEVVNQAFIHQSEASLQALVLPDCKSCSAIMESIVRYREKGQRFTGQYLGVTDAVFSSSLDGVTKVLAETDQSGGKVVDSKGVTVETANQ